MNNISNIQQALNFGKLELNDNNVKDADYSAEILLSEISGLNRQSLYSHFEDYLSDDSINKYINYIKRRSLHEPVQYILGYAYFRGLKIDVCPGVLIPRPETEQLVEVTIKHLSHNYNKILDLCCGSACISCAFANEFSDLKIIASDISSKALECAKRNIDKYQFKEKIELVQSDMDDYIFDNDFDLIITNPPYVPEKIYDSLDAEVRKYEPKIALEAGKDGFKFVERIIDIAKHKLKPYGILAVEFYEDNLELLKQRILDSGFRETEIYKDFANKNRILIAKKNI